MNKNSKGFYKIAVDAMGGDKGINITIPAVLNILYKHKSLNFSNIIEDIVLLSKIYFKDTPYAPLTRINETTLEKFISGGLMQG